MSTPPEPVLGEVRAAEALLGDRELELDAGAVHLRRAWSRLHAAQDADEPLLAWAVAQAGRHVDPARRETAIEGIRWVLGDAPNASPSRTELFDQAQLLRVLAEPTPRRGDLTLWIALALLVVVIASMIAAGLYGVLVGAPGPWRGEYFPNREFEGDPAIRSTRKVEFDWGLGPPLPGFVRDSWSAIFRTCLVLDEAEAGTWRFKLSSDDGARLYVDGKLVVDNWGSHARRTRSADATLDPGTHYVRLDFYDASNVSSLELLAAFGEAQEPKTIPPTLLRSIDAGQKDPCP